MVQDKEQLARYGNAIKNQAAQLRQLIEQILQFASVRRNKNVYDLRPAAVEGIIESALENTSELIRGAGFRVETSIQPRLPSVMMDERALSHSLQNLITNAVKYGGEACWIGISAASRQTTRGSEVLITVADHGIGISSDEAKQIFDPFYRGTEARAAQIHGSGLGLPLAKSMVEAMGGCITVESRPQSGSSFTIHLPATAEAAEANTVPTVNPRESYSKS
jgi:two-component system sensor histidine kinase SenX3